MEINKQFIFYDNEFIPNPFEVTEKRINTYTKENVPKKMGVYVIEKNNNKIYIGKSTNIQDRLQSHNNNGNIRINDNFTFFISDHFNESHISTLETKLIKHSEFFDNKILINTKKNQKEYKYYNKNADEKIYLKLIKEFHDNLLIDIVGNNFKNISSTQEYKISPKTKQLTHKQYNLVNAILKKEEINQLFLLTGAPGTGKSVVAANLADKLCKKNKSILLTSGLTNLNTSFKILFRNNEYKNIVVENTGVAINKFYKSKIKYDFVIIDEGHRLKKNKTGKASSWSTTHIRNNNELEDLLKIGKNIILLFDESQSSMPSDITKTEMLLALKKSNLNINTYDLKDQIRNDIDYELWVNNLLSSENNFKNNSLIDIKVHENFKEMYGELHNDKFDGLNTILVSTPYLKNKKTESHHFDIDSVKLRWSKKDKNWTESNNAKTLKEVGYVDNIQGKDFESVGLIIGNDFYWESSILKVDTTKRINHFQLTKGKEKENYNFAINRLRVFLTRTTKKIHLYILDEKLRNHIKKNI